MFFFFFTYYILCTYFNILNVVICVFIIDFWEESQNTIHMTLRDAISRGDFSTTKTILSELNEEFKEFILNMTPNGSTTLLYWYTIFNCFIYCVINYYY